MTPFSLRPGLTALFLLAGLGIASDGPALSHAQYIEKLQSYEKLPHCETPFQIR